MVKNAIVAEDNMKARKKMTKMLNDRRKTMPANAIHAQAIVSDSAHLGYGNFINARAVLGAYSKVPNHCLIHSGVIIEYNVELGDYVQVGAGTQIRQLEKKPLLALE